MALDDWSIFAIIASSIFAWQVTSALFLRLTGFNAKANENVSAKIHGVLTIAHRGSKLEGLAENSLKAFKSSVAAGIDMVELDGEGTAFFW